MIKIIVVDDDTKMHDDVRRIIRKVIFSYDTEVKIINYTKIDKSLEEEIKDTTYHKIYLLDNIYTPAVLVECGFLSNEKECKLLETDIYQKEISTIINSALSIHANALL